MDHKRPSSGLPVLSSDDLLKIFSCLSPHSLARSCMVCKSWNKIITSSLLWKNIYEESRKHLLQLSCKEGATKKLSFLNGEIKEVVDWKAQFVKEQHKALIVLGSVLVKVWKGHSSRVECCRFQVETIVTGSSDGIVRAWPTTMSHCLETYSVPNKSRVVDLEFDENKILAVSGTEIYIWNRKKGRLLRHIRGHGQHIHSMCYADPEVLVGCADGTIRVFDIYSSRCARIFRQHTERVTCVVVDITSSLVASGSADGTVQLCDFMTGQKISCLLPSCPPTGVVCLHLFQEWRMLVGGTTAGHVHAWDMGRCKLLWSVRIGPNSVTSLHSQFYDESTLFVGSINGVITVLDTGFGVMLKQYVVAQGAKHTRQERADKTRIKLSPAEHVGISMDSSLEEIPRKNRPPVLCLRTGMTKLVTTHPDGSIGLWHFKL